jgi:hypothetical protein
MRVNGKWLLCDDGVIRPVIQGLVRTGEEQWVEVAFILDAGADRTVFSADFCELLQPLKKNGSEQILLSGGGGPANSMTVETVIRLRRDDQRLVSVRGSFAVFTEKESADLSVLGRDVTNNFGVIYDYPNRVVTLLAQPHFYEIKYRR